MAKFSSYIHLLLKQVTWTRIKSIKDVTRCRDSRSAKSIETRYRRLWLFSACGCKLRLQETLHLTDNVHLTSGIIVATCRAQHEEVRDSQMCDMIDRYPSWMFERWTNDKNGEDDKRPRVRRLYFSSRKCDPRPPYFQSDMDCDRDCMYYTKLTQTATYRWPPADLRLGRRLCRGLWGQLRRWWSLFVLHDGRYG